MEEGESKPLLTPVNAPIEEEEEEEEPEEDKPEEVTAVTFALRPGGPLKPKKKAEYLIFDKDNEYMDAPDALLHPSLLPSVWVELFRRCVSCCAGCVCVRKKTQKDPKLPKPKNPWLPRYNIRFKSWERYSFLLSILVAFVSCVPKYVPYSCM